MYFLKLLVLKYVMIQAYVLIVSFWVQYQLMEPWIASILAGSMKAVILPPIYQIVGQKIVLIVCFSKHVKNWIQTHAQIV